MDDKRHLLGRLSIDREEETAPAVPAWLPWAGAAAGLLLGALLMWLIIGTRGGAETPENTPTAQTIASPDTPAAADAATAAPAPAVATATSERVLNASGYVTARRMATVSAQITGRITAVLVEEGTAVEAGQVVARLDDSLARIDLGLARAQFAAARATVAGIRANLDEAERVLKRITALNARDFSSEADLTRARADVERLRADLARAEADRDVARLQVDRAAELVDRHIIRAPFAGVVTDKNAQPGEIVAPGSAGGGFTRTGICTLVDMSSLEIEVDVNESFIGKVFAGQPVEARLDAYPDWVIPAHVIAIIPTANRDKATVKVRIGFDVGDPRILPDMGVNVAFLKD